MSVKRTAATYLGTDGICQCYSNPGPPNWKQNSLFIEVMNAKHKLVLKLNNSFKIKIIFFKVLSILFYLLPKEIVGKFYWYENYRADYVTVL
jgi:hypothetical protein